MANILLNNYWAANLFVLTTTKIPIMTDSLQLVSKFTSRFNFSSRDQKEFTTYSCHSANVNVLYNVITMKSVSMLPLSYRY